MIEDIALSARESGEPIRRLPNKWGKSSRYPRSAWVSRGYMTKVETKKESACDSSDSARGGNITVVGDREVN